MTSRTRRMDVYGSIIQTVYDKTKRDPNVGRMRSPTPELLETKPMIKELKPFILPQKSTTSIPDDEMTSSQLAMEIASLLLSDSNPDEKRRAKLEQRLCQVEGPEPSPHHDQIKSYQKDIDQLKSTNRQDSITTLEVEGDFQNVRPSPMLEAARRKDSKTVLELLQRCANRQSQNCHCIRDANRYHDSPLHIAAENNFDNFVFELYATSQFSPHHKRVMRKWNGWKNNGCPAFSSRQYCHRLPYEIAIESGNKEVLIALTSCEEFFMRNKKKSSTIDRDVYFADRDITQCGTKYAIGALSVAATTGNVHLLQCTINKNLHGNDNFPQALREAAIRSDLHMAAELLKRYQGPNIVKLMTSQDCPVMISVRNQEDNRDSEEPLEYDPTPTLIMTSPVFWAVLNDDVDMIKLFAKVSPKVLDAIEASNELSLYDVAVLGSRLNVLKYLIENQETCLEPRVLNLCLQNKDRNSFDLAWQTFESSSFLSQPSFILESIAEERMFTQAVFAKFWDVADKFILIYSALYDESWPDEIATDLSECMVKVLYSCHFTRDEQTVLLRCLLMLGLRIMGNTDALRKLNQDFPSLMILQNNTERQLVPVSIENEMLESIGA